jgi:pimeloyl-ACP methyl ester carboxylesterase
MPSAGEHSQLESVSCRQAGKAYYDPAKIKVPTLVILAEWDGVTPRAAAQAIFHNLPNGPHKRFVTIGEGTHLIMLEKNRMVLFEEVQFFLEKVHRLDR